MTVWYTGELSSVPHCCGVMEAGYFHERVLDKKPGYEDIAEESPEKFLEKCLELAEGRPVLFNFVKQAVCDDYSDEPTGDFEDEYKANALRQVVKQHKNVVDLGKSINPGGGNKIHTLIIKGYKD